MCWKGNGRKNSKREARSPKQNSNFEFMKKVLVFGAFDGLHPGHIDFFKQAKKLGDFLIVSVGTDKNVKIIKGRSPHFNQQERLGLISSLKIVDKVVLGAEDNFYLHIKDLYPDIVCLGYDQWAKEDEVVSKLAQVGLVKTRVMRLKPHKKNKAKSTILKKKSVDF